MRRVTDQQVRKLMDEMTRHGALGRAAMKAGMHRETARVYVAAGTLPSTMQTPRTWRTREDPFAQQSERIEQLLREQPTLEAKTLFALLCVEFPGVFHEGQLRTLQRRVGRYRATHDDGKALAMLGQRHRPGEAAQTDFTSTTELAITIAGVLYVHLLGVFVLPFSNWTWITVCLSESMLSIRRTVQRALFQLGRVPLIHQTDNSTGATHQIKKADASTTHKRPFNDEYEALNPAAERMFGRARADVLGEPVADTIVPPASRGAHRDGLARYLATGAGPVLGRRIEMTAMRADGSEFPVELSITRVGTGSPASFTGFLRDLSERKETERALRASESRFARLSEVGILGVLVTDLTDRAAVRVLEINDTLLDLVGYTRDEVLSGAVRWRDLTPSEYFELDEQTIEQLAAQGLGGLREKEYLCKDGRRVPVLVGSARVDDDVHTVLSFVLDLSALKKAEATVASLRDKQAAAAKFHGLLEAAPDAMVILGGDGRIALVNTQTERVFGYARDELLGHPVELLVPERFRGGHPAHRADYDRDPRTRAMGAGLDLFARRKDGSEFAVEISLSPLQTPEGATVIAAIRDITARKMTETALKLANRELEAFSYSVAHDLRAPLRGMNGFAQVLLDTYRDKLDAEGQDWLQEILLNAQRMGALIDALLSLARVTRSELKPRSVDLSAKARAVGAQLAARHPEHAVDLVVEEGLRADLDPDLAHALVENLLGNAWKFTGHVAAARVEVGATLAQGAPAFFVRDNGAGFDMAYAENLFVPFRRLHTADEFPGTGIGLATVQRIVQRHGGRVWAEGRVDGGATFFFTLPNRSAEATP